MEESLAMSDTVNNGSFCGNDDVLNVGEMQDTSVGNLHAADVPCHDKIARETVTSEELPEDGPTESVEQVSSAALQTSSAFAGANDTTEDNQMSAVDMNDTVDTNSHSGADTNGHLDTEQPLINGNESVQQPDELKSLDVSDTAVVREPEFAQQNFGAFHRLDHPANVVIDLRSPPLVQVCLLHGADDVGAGGSSSSGVHRQPQTARRGRRLHRGTTGRAANTARSDVEGAVCSDEDKDVHPMSVLDLPSNETVASDGKHRHGVGDKTSAELSTIIHLKVVDTSDERVAAGPSQLSPVTNNDFQLQLHLSDGDHSSESSDNDTMRVRNVNRTYSRNPSISAAHKSPRLVDTPKSTDSSGGKKRSVESSRFSTATTSRHAQGFKSVPKKSKKTGKRRPRIGPAWFSRRFLNAAPPEIWEYVRTSKEVEILKRPNYDSGVRCRPIVASPPSIKQVFEVPVVEDADIATIGREQLKLSRLSEDDVEELKSQLRQEAEHRRSEHIMPLVMQMTDAQIEHAYEHVAESMKTYEIVEADSDEDMAEEQESEEEIADLYDNGRESSDWRSIYEAIGGKGVGETEYSKLRPKRHAVDYGPSAYAPIMLMEGRRMSSQRKSSKAPQMRSGDVDKRQRSRGHKSRRRKSRKSRVTDQMDEVPAEKCTDDTGESTGFYSFFVLQHNYFGIIVKAELLL